ncbi:hypothetical protein PHYBOEH_005414 [Phytophthora boehmeriae]|uniref:Necrosis inducing-like protein NPP1 type n=1 Tax=Phytophthora boehmeriae TaxID=109152 RepID=A0A8T1WK41_9STRA|nr:hypothetical protein PHYBOEH_005414 [Phytophthora boehmeriae]
MSLLVRIAVVVSSLAFVQAATIDFANIVPFPEAKPTSTENTIGLAFKPQLMVARGCHSYPAVDEDGNVSDGGKSQTLLTINCQGSHYGSQVYGRFAKYKEFWAIMYAWYFPAAGYIRHNWEHAIVWIDRPMKNATISAVSTTSTFSRYDITMPVDSSLIDGTSVKIYYKRLYTARYLKPTTHRGQYQDLVMWNDMPEEVRTALENADFDLADVPMIDDNFLANLEEAYPS